MLQDGFRKIPEINSANDFQQCNLLGNFPRIMRAFPSTESSGLEAFASNTATEHTEVIFPRKPHCLQTGRRHQSLQL